MHAPQKTDPTPPTVGEGNAGHAARSPGLHTVTERGRSAEYLRAASALADLLPVGFGHGCPAGARPVLVPRILLRDEFEAGAVCAHCGALVWAKLAPHQSALDTQLSFGAEEEAGEGAEQ